MRSLIKAKLMAAGIHLSISIIIFIGVLYLILVEWYPEPFFTAEGGWQGIRLMAFVDLVLGPTLTLIVFNHTKKKLEIVLDLSVIVLIQIIALTWGGYTVYSKRPLAIAFYEFAFFTVTDDYYQIQGDSRPDFSLYSNSEPPMIAVRSPETEQEHQQFNKLTAMAVPIYAHSYLYEPVKNQLEFIKTKQVDIEEVMYHNALMKEEILAMTNGDVSGYIFMPLQAKFHNVIIVLTEEGEYKGMVKVYSH